MTFRSSRSRLPTHVAGAILTMFTNGTFATAGSGEARQRRRTRGIAVLGRRWVASLLVAACTSLLVASTVHAATYRNVPWLARVLVGIGQRVIVHGVRNSTCGGPAPSWSAAKRTLRTPRLGTFEDGGVGWRYSGRCGGFVPARGVAYRPTRKGTETVLVEGDEIVVLVK